jgi:hypothetical protein
LRIIARGTEAAPAEVLVRLEGARRQAGGSDEQDHEHQYEQPTWTFLIPWQDASFDRAESFHVEGALGTR